MEYIDRGRPSLPTLLVELARANHLQIKPVGTWPEANYVRLGRLASRLEPDEVQTFVDGDYQQALAIAWRHNIWELHKFLNDVFNDDISILV